MIDAQQAAPQQEAQELVLEGYTLPPLSEPDLRDVGTKPQDIKDFLRGYATEYAKRALRLSQPAPAPLSEDVVKDVRKALDRAFIMGQNYWADADSESFTANKRSDVTRQKFNTLRDEVCAALAAQGGK